MAGRSKLRARFIWPLSDITRCLASESLGPRRWVQCRTKPKTKLFCSKHRFLRAEMDERLERLILRDRKLAKELRGTNLLGRPLRRRPATRR